MADYVIGDIQGCYTSLMSLLDVFAYNPKMDRLWCVGDLVNRGPQSLAVLRFFSQLTIPPIITLGNHDLYLLTRLFVKHTNWHNHDDTIDEILRAPDALQLGHWLRKQPLLYHDQQLNVVMTHAGIPPFWTLNESKAYANEVAQALRADTFSGLLRHLFGDEPRYWADSLTGYDRLRCIINFLTRMRFCDKRGGLCLSYKGDLSRAPSTAIPWYAHPMRRPLSQTLVFGHWAALGTIFPALNVYAIDTGCVWGNQLTAFRLQDKKLFSVGAQG